MIKLLHRRRPHALTRRGWLYRAALAFILLLMLVWIGFFQWSMVTLSDDPTYKADVGIVLGASLWNEVPSPALMERLQRAVELYEAGRVARLIVSGGNGGKQSKLSEAEGMRNELVRRGIPESMITMEGHSTSTIENLRFSQQVMLQKGWVSAIIITHRYHGVRALDMAQFLGYNHPIVSPMDSNVIFMPWHKTRETLAMIKWQWDKLQLSHR